MLNAFDVERNFARGSQRIVEANIFFVWKSALDKHLSLTKEAPLRYPPRILNNNTIERCFMLSSTRLNGKQIIQATMGYFNYDQSNPDGRVWFPELIDKDWFL